MASGPMSSTRSSRSTALPLRLDILPLASEIIWPSRISSRSGIDAEGGHAGLQAGDLALMVGTEHVDHPVEAADAGTCCGGRRCRRPGRCSRRPTCAAPAGSRESPKSAGAQPGRAVLFEDQAPGAQELDGLVDRPLSSIDAWLYHSSKSMSISAICSLM